MDTRRELGDLFGYPSFDTVMFYTALTLSKLLNGKPLPFAWNMISAARWRVCHFVPRTIESLRQVIVYEEWVDGHSSSWQKSVRCGSSNQLSNPTLQSSASRGRVDSMSIPTIWKEQRHSWSTSKRRRRWVNQINHSKNKNIKEYKGFTDTDVMCKFKVASNKKKPSKFARGMTKKDIAERLEQAVVRAKVSLWRSDQLDVSSFSWNYSYLQEEFTKSNGQSTKGMSEMMMIETFEKDEDVEQVSKKMKEGETCLLPKE